jgi:hypothetical protein
VSLSRKHLEPLATMIGAAMLAADVVELDELPQPARDLARSVRHFASTAPNFNGSRFDAWALDVAEGRRYPATGERIPAASQRVAVSA